MDFLPSELPSEGDLFNFERFDKGYDAEDICCVICGAPSFIKVVEAEVRNKNLERYKWFVPKAIRAENYHYEKDWDIASLPNHDLPLEVLGIDEIEIDGVHYGERLSRLEPVRYEEHSSKLVHDLYTEYPYVTVHSECLDMLRRLVDYRQALLKAGVSVGPKRPTTLSQFYEVFEQRLTRVHWGYPLGRNGSFFPRRVVEPHCYYFRDTDLFHNVAWAFGDQKVYEYEMAPYPIPGLTQEILSYLRPLPPSLQGQSGISLELEALPTELQDMIYKNLHPFINPKQTCTRSLPSRLWRDLLFNQQILPWLWDLDISALQSCPVTSDAVDVPTFEAEEVWDWESLVRTLAQLEVFEPGQPLEHAPLRLRNRRRIWRLLEEAEDEDIEGWLDAHVYKRK
ncbi:contactin [Aspergillus udagawae]|uniref:Contactin n=1 Tax=Aspergillus udagawae TaxID=91492 RepID=A0A8H3RW21_9EURO|nr:contactin [Aspergillus udagawae]